MSIDYTPKNRFTNTPSRAVLYTSVQCNSPQRENLFSRGRFRSTDLADCPRCIDIDFLRPNSRDSRMNRHRLCRHRQSLLGPLPSADYIQTIIAVTIVVLDIGLCRQPRILHCTFGLATTMRESSQSQRDRVDKIAMSQSSEVMI